MTVVIAADMGWRVAEERTARRVVGRGAEAALAIADQLGQDDCPDQPSEQYSVIILLVAALAASTDPRSQVEPRPAAPPSAQPGPAEKPICRKTIPTGSMFATRACHSKAEWAAIDEQNARNTRNARDRSGGASPRGQ